MKNVKVRRGRRSTVAAQYPIPVSDLIATPPRRHIFLRASADSMNAGIAGLAHSPQTPAEDSEAR